MAKGAYKVFDELLILQYQAGNRKALTLLVKRWNSKMLHQAYLHSQNYDASRDIVQESWQSVISSLKKLRDPAAFPLWVRRIVRGKSIDWIRIQQKKRKMLENHEIEETLEIDNNDTGVTTLRIALKQLSGEQRILLNMHYLGNRPLQEISEVLSVPVGTVKSRLFHARKKLLNLFKRINKTEE